MKLWVLGLAYLSSLALFAADNSASDHKDAAVEELIAGHLAQAKQIDVSATQPGTDQELRRLKEELLAKQQAWSQKLKQDFGTAGIPPTVLEQARKAAPDAGATRATLKEGVALPLLLALISERSPEVLSAYQNWRASTRRFTQAAYLEDLLSQYRAFTRELDTKVGPQTHKDLPGVYPSTLALKGQLVDAEVEIARLNYLAALRKTVSEAAKMFFDVQYTAQAVKLVKESRALFAQMEESARTQLEAGNVSQADALKAKTELALLDTKIVTLERERVNQIAKINAMLALPLNSEWGPMKESDLLDIEIAPEETEKQALANNQDYLAARKEAEELMPVMLRMAEVEVNSRASAGYSQFAPSLGADAGPTRSMLATFPEKPEVSGGEAAMFSANVAYLEELRVRVKQSKDLVVLAGNKAEFAAKDAEFRLDRARRDKKTLSETVVPDSKQAFATLNDRYRNNAAPLIECLDAGRSYLENTLMLQAARRDHNQAIVDLQDAMGEIISDRKAD
jgi:outer membrane protein TolC